jgi:hypothetical protein
MNTDLLIQIQSFNCFGFFRKFFLPNLKLTLSEGEMLNMFMVKILLIFI